MLNWAQRWIVFWLFCLMAVAGAAMEGYLIYAFIQNKFSDLKGIIAVLNTGLLYGMVRVFKDLVIKTFVNTNIVPPSRLHRLASERSATLQAATRTGQDLFVSRQNLVTSTLKFSEECLNGWVGGSHFEFCVFVDQEQPLLFAYFDSNQDVTARSMAERERNPHFYTQKNYEVTKLLGAPTSHPKVLRNTEDSNVNYTFTTTAQRKQLKSTVLLCLDVATPCALVVSSNKANAFDERDSDVMFFIKFVGEAIRYDLLENDFIHQVRSFRPDLFEGAALQN